MKDATYKEMKEFSELSLSALCGMIVGLREENELLKETNQSLIYEIEDMTEDIEALKVKLNDETEHRQQLQEDLGE